jgi:methionyl-tRNA formyltransferase
MLPRWAEGRITAEPQDDRRATYAPKIEREDARLDWSRSAMENWRRVRAYRGGPDAFTTWEGQRLKVLASHPAAAPADAPPGQVVVAPEEPGVPAVVTTDGVLVLDCVALEGRGPTDGAAFLRGRRDFLGAGLGASCG